MEKVLSNSPLTALIIGAGFSGICTAIKLKQAGIDNILIAEKTAGLSGTWHDNSYPGAACDVPSHLYSFSFAPNPNWSRRFSPSYEIKAYVEKVVKDYDITKHIRQNTEIVSAKFDSKTALWQAVDAQGNLYTARFIVTSVAILGTPQLPVIDGMYSFDGPAFHSARWDHSVDLTGKRIAVIGSAASALQLIPEIAKTAAHVNVFQRTANFVIARGDRAYTRFEKSMFRILPWTMKITRARIYIYLDNLFYRNFQQGSFINKFLTKMAASYRKKQISDPELREILTPTYAMGCKRILLSDNYYTALQRDNVSVITGDIDKITPAGIATKNAHLHEADILVYATGFKTTNFLTGIEMNGTKGAALTTWRKNPKALRGLVIENMPNAFFLLGPNTNLGHSSMILMIEAQVKYMVKCMQAVPNGQYISVKSSAMKTYNEDLQNKLDTSVWATGCQSWYKNPDGTIPTMWPYQTAHFAKMMKNFDLGEYDLVEAG